MSLATRCTNCGTVFRVVQDQLKVSEGWVRCGKCQEVFSAMDGLFDLDAKTAAAPAPGTGSGFAPSPAVARPADAGPSTIAAPYRGSNTLFDQPFFAPPEKAASVWRGKRGDEMPVSEPAADRFAPTPTPTPPPAPAAAPAPAPAPASNQPAWRGLTPDLDDSDADRGGALQIQPLADEEQPFVLRRPAVEARAFDRPSNLRHLPGSQALRDATSAREAQTETIPATFDRAHADEWRPAGSNANGNSDADAETDVELAASRGLHIDLLIDDDAGRVTADRSTPGRADVERPSPRIAAPPEVSLDSHVLGGTLTDGSLDQHIADAADPPPAFLRDAERRTRRDTPRQRQLLVGLAAAMAVLLCLQLVFHSRDVLAARFPAMHSPLAAMCVVAGCTLGPPRRIDDVVVDSSALTRVEGMDAFQLTVVLHNRSSMLLAMPSIDLSLTDTDGQLVSRRALQPADFASSATSLPPSGDQTLKLLLSAGERRVTGYTVELFYP